MDGRRSFLSVQTGRSRSNSQRSQTSQRSRGSLERPEPDYGRRASIRIRRIPSSQNLSQTAQQHGENAQLGVDRSNSRRRRSNSAPQRLHEAAAPDFTSRASYMPDISESYPTTSFPTLPDISLPADDPGISQRPITPLESIHIDHARTVSGKPSPRTPQEEEEEDDEYGTDLVDLLDIVGMQFQFNIESLPLARMRLIQSRSRSRHSIHSYECSKFIIRS
jgi:hypothetical protein